MEPIYLFRCLAVAPDSESFALGSSAPGKYDSAAFLIQVFQLNDAEARVIPIAKSDIIDSRQQGIEGIQFSSDGKTIGVLLATFSSVKIPTKIFRILEIDSRSGELLQVLECGPEGDNSTSYNRLRHRACNYNGVALLSTPNDEGWLVYGHKFVPIDPERPPLWIYAEDNHSHTGPFVFLNENDFLVLDPAIASQSRNSIHAYVVDGQALLSQAMPDSKK